jgi:ABC-2 type transport system permease protein
VEILPHTMQKMALISPLHWSLDAVNQITLRNGGLSSIAAPSAVLLATGAAMWFFSSVIHNRQKLA